MSGLKVAGSGKPEVETKRNLAGMRQMGGWRVRPPASRIRYGSSEQMQRSITAFRPALMVSA